MKAFLMIGQSNMAGRGDLCDVEPIKNPHCDMLRMGRWIEMSEPVNPDRPVTVNGRGGSGISLAARFADEYAKKYGEDVGLIPAAYGGTSLSDWQPGGILFDHAVAISKIAQRSSRIIGILWHQGEYDANLMKNVSTYRERFINMTDALFHELELAEDTPIIIGGVGDFLDTYTPLSLPLGRELNRELQGIRQYRPNVAFASAEGLTCKNDNIHFDSVSLRIFGKRYFTEYEKLIEKKKANSSSE